MALDETVSEFLGRIYEGADDGEAWAKVMRDLIAMTHSRLLFVSTVDTRRMQYQRTRFYGPEESRLEVGLQEYVQDLYRMDRTLRYAADHPHGRFCDTRQVFPGEDYFGDPYIRWQRDRLGSTHFLVGYSLSEDGLTFGASIHPPASTGPPAEQDAQLFRMLFDHLDHAVRLAARPPRFDEAGQALLSVGYDGRTLQVSEAAGEILALRDGLTISGGRLRAAAPAHTARLNAAIRSALDALSHGGAGGAVRLPRPSGGGEWLVTVTPMPRPATPCSAFGPKALVRITDPRKRGRLSALQPELFGLTKTEAKVADLLLAGHSLESLAASLGVSLNTVKVHLQSLFHKTGTHRQADLVSLLFATGERPS